MLKVIDKIKDRGRIVVSGVNDVIKTYFYPETLVNHYGGLEDFWIAKFVSLRKEFMKNKKRITYISVFRRRFYTKFICKKNIKIFYTGENINSRFIHCYPYNDMMLSEVDLSLGFNEWKADNYLRFPIWIEYIFSFNETFESIKSKIEKWNSIENRTNSDRTDFCALVSSHDMIFDDKNSRGNKGNRTKIYELLEDLGRIDCAGKLMNNTDRLKVEFKDNKSEFLRRYKFNICPENSNAKGYVTEKIFQSIISGCIPIYWGGVNTPELDILNQEAILFFDPENPKLLRDKVLELVNDPQKYREFISQPPFLPNAAEIIYEKYFLSLDRKLRKIFNEKSNNIRG